MSCRHEKSVAPYVIVGLVTAILSAIYMTIIPLLEAILAAVSP